MSKLGLTFVSVSFFALGCHHSMNVSLETILKAPIPQQTCLIVTSE